MLGEASSRGTGTLRPRAVRAPLLPSYTELAGDRLGVRHFAGGPKNRHRRSSRPPPHPRPHYPVVALLHRCRTRTRRGATRAASRRASPCRCVRIRWVSRHRGPGGRTPPSGRAGPRARCSRARRSGRKQYARNRDSAMSSGMLVRLPSAMGTLARPLDKRDDGGTGPLALTLIRPSPCRTALGQLDREPRGCNKRFQLKALEVVKSEFRFGDAGKAGRMCGFLPQHPARSSQPPRWHRVVRQGVSVRRRTGWVSRTGAFRQRPLRHR